MKVTKNGQKYLDSARIADASILIDPMRDRLSRSTFKAKRMSREHQLSDWTDKLIRRTSALLKLATHIYRSLATTYMHKEHESER